MESLEKKFGPAHRDVGAALNNLAQLYGNQGRDAEAEPLFKRAIAILEKAVGLDSPEIAAALNNLAALYQRQERYADAEPLFKRALAIREKIARRAIIPISAQSLNNLATHVREARAATAIPNRCSSGRWRSTKRRRVRNIPRSRRLLNNLGQVGKVQGRYAEAEPLIRRSLAIREKVLGRDHPDVARSLNNLADLYERQGRYAEACRCIERALAIRETAVGPDHPDTATSAEQSGGVLSGRGPRRPTRCRWCRRLIASGRAQLRVALAGAGRRAAAAIDAGRKALDDALNAIQRGTQSRRHRP